MTTDQKTEYYDYLDLVRESGKINMLAAAPHLAKEFDLDIKEARKILSDWMKDFGK